MAGFGKAGLGGGARARKKLRKMNVLTPRRRQRSFLNQERKFIDYSVTYSPVTDTMAFMDDTTALCLNGVAQNDDYNNRIGRRITVKSVHVRGYLFRDDVESATNPNGDEIFRIMLVLDTQANNAQGTSTNITSKVNTFRVLEFVDRYKVLKDKTMRAIQYNNAVEAANLFDTATTQIPFKMNYTCNVDVHFSTTGATIAAIVDNAFHLLTCNLGGTSQGTWSIVYTSRVRYVDG